MPVGDCRLSVVTGEQSPCNVVRILGSGSLHPTEYPSIPTPNDVVHVGGCYRGAVLLDFGILGEVQRIVFRLMLSSCACVCVCICVYTAFVNARKTV